jgi:glutamate-1-semialdehyde aminotransferase
LNSLLKREQENYAANNPNSLAQYQDAKNLFGGVPMTWMNKWSGGFPLYLDSAHGNTITDIDGHSYIDFALGDTGAMAGHSPEPSVKAIISRMQDLGGITTMLPTQDAQWVGAELTSRFGMPWSISQLGARAEYRFTFPAPENGTQSMLAADDELDEFMHLFMCNRGILMTPFHNMALMCPTTTQEQVDLHYSLFRKALIELVQA